jgi:hypothetical protein
VVPCEEHASSHAASELNFICLTAAGLAPRLHHSLRAASGAAPGVSCQTAKSRPWAEAQAMSDAPPAAATATTGVCAT